MTCWSEEHGRVIQSTHTPTNFETKQYIKKRKEEKCIVKKEEYTIKEIKEVEDRPVGYSSEEVSQYRKKIHGYSVKIVNLRDANGNRKTVVLSSVYKLNIGELKRIDSRGRGNGGGSGRR